MGFGNIVCLYQKYMLIHEMVHYYLRGSTPGLQSKPREEYDLTECVQLSEALSLKNPQNYQALVAMVEQRCIEAPSPFILSLSMMRTEGLRNRTSNSTLVQDGQVGNDILSYNRNERQ